MQSTFQKKLKAFKKKAKKSPVKSYGTLILGTFLFLGLFFVAALVLTVRWGLFGPLPTESQLLGIQNDNASIVYSEDDQILGKYFIQNRTSVDYDEISPLLINALIATEDSRFFHHKGIDLRSWGRVFFKTILLQDQSSGGGSTLSQQLSKNLFPRENYWLLSIPVAKIKEMFIATRLEQVYDKDELLNLYLNTVPFGANLFGVQAASKTFFNTNAKDLNIQQAAVLVGMLKANTKFNPVRNPKYSKARRNVVLAQMARYGYLRPSDLDSLKQTELITDYSRASNNSGLATYFREHLRQELKSILPELEGPKGESYNMYTDGLKIRTTINSKLQRFAEEAVHEHLKSLQTSFDDHWKGRKAYGSEKNIQLAIKRTERYQQMKKARKSEEDIKEAFEQPHRMSIFTYEGDEVVEMSPLDSLKYYYCLLNAGFLAADPESGKILAWVGGIDHKYLQYDHVKSRRQTGSVFKPVVYANALKSGLGPCDYIHNRLVTYSDYDDWQPHNSDGEYGGVYSMEGGIRSSINSIAVDLIMRTGIDSVRNLAHELGVSSKIPNAPAIALGVSEISLFDMVQVYATFANQGVRQDLAFIDRIETKDGKLLYQREESAPERVLSEEESQIMDHLLQAVVDSGTAKRLRFRYQLEGQIAGKTGTTQSHADGWFMGYHPKLVAGVWVGAEYPSVRFRSLSLGQGANTALPVYGIFMRKVSKWKATKKWAQAEFRPKSEAVLAMLDCLPYLEEEPIAEEDFEESDDFYNALDELFDRFKKDKNKERKAPRVNKSPQSKSSQQKKEQDRIKKQNEKLRKKRARKKKRSKVWSDIFG